MDIGQLPAAVQSSLEVRPLHEYLEDLASITTPLDTDYFSAELSRCDKLFGAGKFRTFTSTDIVRLMKSKRGHMRARGIRVHASRCDLVGGTNAVGCTAGWSVVTIEDMRRPIFPVRFGKLCSKA